MKWLKHVKYCSSQSSFRFHYSSLLPLLFSSYEVWLEKFLFRTCRKKDLAFHLLLLETESSLLSSCTREGRIAHPVVPIKTPNPYTCRQKQLNNSVSTNFFLVRFYLFSKLSLYIFLSLVIYILILLLISSTHIFSSFFCDWVSFNIVTKAYMWRYTSTPKYDVLLYCCSLTEILNSTVLENGSPGITTKYKVVLTNTFPLKRVTMQHTKIKTITYLSLLN
jgi:hypothetical protein